MSFEMGAQVPRRGNAFSRWLGRTLLRLLGWEVRGGVPDHPKMVLIGAPHTTNMDGVIALAVLTAFGLRASTMIKDTAFKGIMGPILRWFGAVPINRRSPKGIVEQTVDAFEANEKFILLVAPEGTRSAAPEWKRGFYHIASGAKVPIVAAGINYATKVVTFNQPLLPSGDYAADFAALMRFYAGTGGPRHAERLSKPMAEALGIAWTPRQDED